MRERKGVVTFGGRPVTLLGEPVKSGDPMPDARLVDNELAEVRLASLTGRVLVVASLPSLDTPVCDIETRRFNQEAADMGDLRIVAVSMDLPFAQKRWCGAAGVERVLTLSDHRYAEFGEKWGLLVKENRLLARAVYVVDRKGVVTYGQLVPEAGDEPDYRAVMEAARAALE